MQRVSPVAKPFVEHELAKGSLYKMRLLTEEERRNFVTEPKSKDPSPQQKVQD